MNVIRIGRKGRHLNTLKRYIYKIYKNSVHINDVHIEAHNPIFQIVHELGGR
jgi:hypothetical protein